MRDWRLRKIAFICLAVIIMIAGLAAGDGYVSRQADSYDCSAQSIIPEDQCVALVKIYEGTGGVDWTVNTNWLESDDPCNWQGVSCVDGTIVALDLYSNNLQGELPLEIGAFPDLVTLTLNDNPLTGAVPLTITLLDLRLIHFHNTEMCEPADPAFQDWLFGVVYRISTGVFCSPPAPTATLPQSGPTALSIQPTSELPWPQQTLTALAEIAATEVWAATSTVEPTPTKYYTVNSPTPEWTETPLAGEGDDPSSSDQDAQGDDETIQTGIFAGVPRYWLLLLLIPVGLIAIGLLLEIRERRKKEEPFDEDDEITESLFKLDYFDPKDDN